MNMEVNLKKKEKKPGALLFNSCVLGVLENTSSWRVSVPGQPIKESF